MRSMRDFRVWSMVQAEMKGAGEVRMKRTGVSVPVSNKGSGIRQSYLAAFCR